MIDHLTPLVTPLLVDELLEAVADLEQAEEELKIACDDLPAALDRYNACFRYMCRVAADLRAWQLECGPPVRDCR